MYAMTFHLNCVHQAVLMRVHNIVLCRNKTGVIDDSFFLIETICCDPSSEPSQRDGSYEGSKHMVLCRINTHYGTPNYHQILPLI